MISDLIGVLYFVSTVPYDDRLDCLNNIVSRYFSSHVVFLHHIIVWIVHCIMLYTLSSMMLKAESYLNWTDKSTILNWASIKLMTHPRISGVMLNNVLNLVTAFLWLLLVLYGTVHFVLVFFFLIVQFEVSKWTANFFKNYM